MSLRPPQITARAPQIGVRSAVLVLVLGLGLAATTRRADDAGPADRGATAPTSAVAAPGPPPDPAVPPGPGRLVARVRHATWLSPRPARPAIARLLPRTEHGTPRVLSVVRRQGQWLGVVAEERPNGRLGWIHLDTNIQLARERHTVEIFLRRRELVLRRDGRPIAGFSVAVGAPGTPTPTGRFAVTDRLVNRPGSPYGCCALALSGHQPYLEPGWSGGNRIAIHATPLPQTVGHAVSHGCLRATDGDMRRLLRSAAPGTLVVIHA